MSDKSYPNKKETMGVGGLSSLALLWANQYFAHSEWLTFIQASIPFIVSILLYLCLYGLAHLGVDNVEVHSAKKALNRKKEKIKETLKDAKERQANEAHIAKLNAELEDVELAILALHDSIPLQPSKAD